MLRDDSGNGGGRPSAPRNVLGDRLDDAFFALLGSARAASADTALSAAIDGAWREPQSRA
jgi:hypothetical protein